MIRSQRTQTLLNEKQLVKLIFPREHRISIDKLTQNASDCPNIDLFRIGCSNQQLRGTVPSGSHVVSEFFLVGRPFEGPRKPEIAYFKLLFITDQQVFRLYVPVDAVQGVHVGQSFEQLVHKQPNDFRLESVGRLLKHF